MGKSSATLINWLGGWFTKLGALLEGIGRPIDTKTKYVNLAPTDKADKDGVYSEALLFATTDPKVRNIALTGPYGSGKSSIIGSFIKTQRIRPLYISLAAFAKENNTEINYTSASAQERRQEIERSILQQMLYGADANNLPLSRFKRIQSPGFLAILKSLYIMLGMISVWYVFTKREMILSGSFFEPLSVSNWPKFAAFGVSLLFLWSVLHNFYVASFGLSLKSISLRDVEIRPASDNLDSILNRHLDEIIYFFQSTDYDLVVIEDLDRFEDAEIFVTLREINSLVNANAGVRRTIRFLYALRDDVFVNTERTKFFEFIIPVIPIINASNSIDMVLKQEKRLRLDGRLDPQFLREVSRYLNDLRLIQNIFNEYAIYVANLETDGENTLNADKLLAILIYKNVYPRDFEQLHRGEGNFARLLGRLDEFLAHSESTRKAEIAELERKMHIAERQIPSDLKELRRIYAMALVEKLPAETISVSIDGSSYTPITLLVGSEAFDQIIAAKTIVWRNVYNHMNRVDLSTLQHEVDAQKTYLQRKGEIEEKSEEKRSENLRRIRELRSQIASLRTIKFDELVRSGAERVTDLFNEFGDKGDLARYLILEGYLDDTYYQYTSLFHSGRLSPNDNKFLRQVRAFRTPDPGFQIDNPNEIIAAMREADFEQSYVLNVKLVDCLLSEPIRYSEQARKLLEFISSHFEVCEDFFDAYYATGGSVSELLARLAEAWKQFIPTAIASERNLSHLTQIVTHLPAGVLTTIARGSDEFPNFVASRLPDILATAPDLAPERLEHIGLEIRDLPSISRYPGIVRFMVLRGRFELTIANLEHAFSEVLAESDLRAFRERNYTTLRSLNDPALMKRVQRDLDLYLSDVLLELEANTQEDAAAITDLLGREGLDEDKLREFLDRQAALLPTLEDVPEKFHTMVFELRRIMPTWKNCILFMAGSGFAAEILVAYLDSKDVRAAILSDRLPNDPETLQLRQFLLNANGLSDDGYREYVRKIPNMFTNFPKSVDSAKLTILIDERKITFSKESLERLDVNTDLPVVFVAENIKAYLADPGMFGLDDVFRERLLQAAITDDDKRAIVELMDLTTLTELPKRAAVIGPILDRTNVRISGLDAAKARSLILHSRPVETQISLFNKTYSTMTDNEAREVLAALPNPFSEITTGYHTPRLPRSDENRTLVQWLETRGIISSWSEGGGVFLSDAIRVNLKRR
ncbi:MAG: ATP-binding protein [Microcystis flos-aquae Mf_WU_F_19750830_S460]|uniref:ATP-binding protein n=1 Tax=Microcystis flos-aquae Mf_WU_F_19750830_S460 TaxID=2486237 RepID=A0A552M0A1_9CHRO|nr:MAG: ATP-binding protein [Microcystis flos-aquae Mf_WU_F_19750830_S460]